MNNDIIIDLSFINLLDSPILITNRTGKIIAVNKAFEQWQKVPVSSIIGKNVGDLISHDQHDLLSNYLQSGVFSTHDKITLEWRYDLRNPVRISVTFHSVCLNNGENGVMIIVNGIPSAHDDLQLYKAVFEFSSDAIAILDPNGKYLMQNDAHRNMIGYSNEEIEGKTPAMHMGEQVFHEVFEELSKHGRCSGEFECITKSGKHLIIILSAFAIIGADGNPEYFVGIKRDITESKLVEEKLHSSQQRLRQVIDLVPHQIFLKDRHGNLVLVNKAVAEAFGTTVEELIGKNHRNIHPNKEEVERFLEEDQQVIQTGKEMFIHKHPFTYYDGTVHWLETRKIPVEFADYGTCVLGVSLDITRRIQIEDALRESEERYKSLIETNFDGVLIHDRGKIIEVNQQLADMFGYSVEEAIGRSLLDFASPSSAPLIREQMFSQSGNLIEVIGVKKDGTQLILEVISNDCMYKGRKVRISAIRDVTQKKLMERAYKAATDRALLYLDLMSHDLRNQFQLVVGYATLAMEMLDDPELINIMDMIVASVDVCESIIHKVAITEQLISQPLREVNLNQILDSCLSDLSSKWSSVKFISDINLENVTIMANEFLGFLFSLLIEYLIVHNPHDDRTVWISAVEVPNGYDISIADNGPGITDERKSDVFDIHRRFSGIDIYQAKQIVERIGGTIFVEDRVPGKSELGTCFVIHLPRVPLDIADTT